MKSHSRVGASLRRDWKTDREHHATYIIPLSGSRYSLLLFPLAWRAHGASHASKRGSEWRIKIIDWLRRVCLKKSPLVLVLWIEKILRRPASALGFLYSTHDAFCSPTRAVRTKTPRGCKTSSRQTKQIYKTRCGEIPAEKEINEQKNTYVRRRLQTFFKTAPILYITRHVVYFLEKLKFVVTFATNQRQKLLWAEL